MMRFVFTSFFVATAVFFSACETQRTTRDQRTSTTHRYGYRSDTEETTVGPEDTGATPRTDENSTPTNVVPPPPPPSRAEDRSIATNPGAGAGNAAPQKKDYPYATPVPGKQGFVTSPYMPYAGYVDVRGFPPGTEVKDPYSGKIFLVP